MGNYRCNVWKIITAKKKVKNSRKLIGFFLLEFIAKFVVMKRKNVFQLKIILKTLEGKDITSCRAE